MTDAFRGDYFCSVLELDFDAIKKSGGNSFEVFAETEPELAEAGCFGQQKLVAKVIPMSGKYLVQAYCSGQMHFDCPTCGAPRDGEFSVDFKLIVGQGKERGCHWSGDEGLDFNEYWVEIGPDVEKIPVSALIREQVLLNCNPAKSVPDGLKVTSCASCGGKIPELPKSVDPPLSDPRWDKLKTLLNKNG